MAEDRRRRALQRRQSVRMAQKATRKALSELPSSQRPGTSTRPILRETREFTALSTQPSITFATQQGRLIGRRGIRGTARHEVAHHLGAGHGAIRAATGGLGGLSRPKVQQAVRLQKEPVGRRVQRALQTRGKWGVAPSQALPSTSSGPTSGPIKSYQVPGGFSTPHLRKVVETGTPTRQRQAREKMRKLGRRLKGRVDF